MLLIFALAVTPKRYLHDVFANHTHHFSTASQDGTEQVNPSLATCDCDHLVALSPFIGEETLFTVLPTLKYSIGASALSSPLFSSSPAFFQLRGPPVA
ncbi:MAG: hypothetical protein H7Y03_03230 [Chitinophagaceae bacterium]|nr:hypothetical protein [Chitinophagaceae bacterium]